MAFVDLQGTSGEEPAKLLRRSSRRHTDIGLLGSPPGLEYLPGSKDSGRDEEDIKVPATRRASLVSFVSSVDSDDFIGAPSLNMAIEWSSRASKMDSTCHSVDTKAEIAWAPCSSSGSTVSSCSHTPWAPCLSSDSTLSSGSQLPWAPCSSVGSTFSSGSLTSFLYAVQSSPQSRQGYLPGTSPARELRQDDNGEEPHFVPHDSEEAENRTTVMVRNVPTSLCQSDFVNQLKQRGFNGLFDFVYLPMNLREHGSFGYAFVNFTSVAVAEIFMRQIASLEHDDKEWRAVWSTCQGKAANVDRYQNSPLMHKSVPADCKPALYDERGLRVQFPAPTKNIPKPRIHHTKGKSVEKDSEFRKIGVSDPMGAYNNTNVIKSQDRQRKSIGGERVWPSMSKMSVNVAAHMMGQFSIFSNAR